jgi:hypothetical protein
MSISRYFRLMLLSCLEMGLTTPLGIYSIYINVAGKAVQPWISWSDTHYDFSRVLQVPAIFWRANRQATIAYELGRWVYPCAAIIFFCLFGFAEEARRHYRAAFWWMVKPFGLRPRVTKSPLSSGYRYAPSFLQVSRAKLRHSIPSSRPMASPPSTAHEFLPAYAASSADVVLQASKFKFAPKSSDVEKTAESPSSFSTFYLTHKPSDTNDTVSSADIECIIITGPGEQDAVELVDFPSSPSASFSSSSLADIGLAH